MNRSPLCAFLLIALAVGWLGLSPGAQAVVPAPDGGYPGGNTAEGKNALFSLTTGTKNTANGFQALFSNTTGIQNTGNGALTLHSNTIGFQNTANGYQALYSNTTGEDNTANGSFALFSNGGGFNNTADGFQALTNNTDGSENTANGVDALILNTTGELNTATGESALFSNTTGSGNIALGAGAGFRLTTGDNNINIGNQGVADEANTIRIGDVQTAAYIAGISGATVAGGVGVIVDTNGHLGTTTSSARFKDNIRPMNNASEAILSLEPVTFRYKKELDPQGIPQFGLVAEEVEKVDPDLVARDNKGKPFSVRYEAVNAMLLNEFLKEHRKVEELEATVAHIKSAETQQKDLQATVAQQQKQIETLTAGLEKVSAQVEMSRPAPRTVVSNQ